MKQGAIIVALLLVCSPMFGQKGKKVEPPGPPVAVSAAPAKPAAKIVRKPDAEWKASYLSFKSEESTLSQSGLSIASLIASVQELQKAHSDRLATLTAAMNSDGKDNYYDEAKDEFLPRPAQPAPPVK